MKTKLLTLLLVVLMVGVGILQFSYDSHRDYFSARKVFVTLPSGKTLKILSFGFQNLVADLLYIWSIQFYSSYHLTNIYDYIEHVFNVITDLNPLSKEPYLVGSWIMSLEANDVNMAMRLLQKGARNIPDEWLFDYECGFYAYKHLRDFELAEKYFARAAAKPDAPPHIARKRAHMVYMKDDLNYARQLWMDIYRNTKDRFERKVARNHLHQIKLEMDKKFLEQRIALFKRIYKRLPHNLQELKQARLVKEIPKDFDGEDYIYNPEKGTITAEKVLRWKKSL